jgi:hypothetical protein
MRRSLSGALLLGALTVLVPAAAIARPQYLQAFVATYQIKPTSNLGKAQCLVCHAGADKKVRNPYGIDLAKTIAKVMATQQDAAAAIKKVENLKCPDKKTAYVVLIQQDKLPGGAPAQ